MKSTVLTIAGMLLAGSAAAAPSHSDAARGVFNGSRAVPGSKIEVNGKTFVVGDPAMLKNSGAAPAKSRRIVEVPEAITTPQGLPQEYSKTSGGYYYYGGYSSYQDAAQAATIYWDGDDAYIYNILSYKETDTYVKGTREGDRLVVPLNQVVDKGDDFDIRLGLLRTDIAVGANPDPEEDDDPNVTYIFFLYNNDYETVSYKIGEDGKLTLEIPSLPEGVGKPDDGYEHLDPSDFGFPDYCLGFYYTDDKTWTGDGDIFQTYEEFNYELVTLPEGAEFRYYSYVNSSDNGVLVNIARVGDELYFKGLSAYAPEAVFKADIVDTGNGLQARVPQNQFVGKSQDGYYNLLTKTETSDRFGNYDLAAPDVPAIFDITADENGNFVQLTSDNKSNILLLNYADDFLDPYDEFPGITLRYQETLDGEPLPPEGAYFEDHSQWLGAFWLFFYLDMFTEEGNILDVNELYYRIYVNGEPFEFVQHDGLNLRDNFVTMYLGVNPATTLIPYTFYNGNDLFYDEFHLYYVGFYDVTGFETIGVQTVYTYGGVEKCSEIRTIDVRQVVGGVDEIAPDSDGAPIYYDLQGRRVAHPSGGLYIRLQNGKASKVLLP